MLPHRVSLSWRASRPRSGRSRSSASTPTSRRPSSRSRRTDDPGGEDRTRPARWSMMQKLLTALALATVLVASGGTAQAQAPNTGTLRVAVKDATDLGLPHAVVVLTDATGASREAPVDAEGVATFTGLGPGVYQVLARADGFREMALAVTVRPGQQRLGDAAGRHLRGGHRGRGGRRHPPRQRFHAGPVGRRDRRAVGRSRRDGRAAGADGRARGADLRRRVPGGRLPPKIRSRASASTATRSRPGTTRPAWSGSR